jgi:dihydroorotase-like cyclic amidohydrolase
MTPRRTGRTQACGVREARTRMEHARAFLEVAELVGAEQDELATPSVTAALAVLAGIAAADAACCARLGQRSRGQDHTQALALLTDVAPDGSAMARDVERLLAVKDDAHYGLLHVSAQRAAAALRQARRLVDTAASHVQ